MADTYQQVVEFYIKQRGAKETARAIQSAFQPMRALTQLSKEMGGAESQMVGKAMRNAKTRAAISAGMKKAHKTVADTQVRSITMADGSIKRIMSSTNAWGNVVKKNTTTMTSNLKRFNMNLLSTMFFGMQL